MRIKLKEIKMREIEFVGLTLSLDDWGVECLNNVIYLVRD